MPIDRNGKIRPQYGYNLMDNAANRYHRENDAYAWLYFSPNEAPEDDVSVLAQDANTSLALREYHPELIDWDPDKADIRENLIRKDKLWPTGHIPMSTLSVPGDRNQNEFYLATFYATQFRDGLPAGPNYVKGASNAQKTVAQRLYYDIVSTYRDAYRQLLTNPNITLNNFRPYIASLHENIITNFSAQKENIVKELDEKYHICTAYEYSLEPVNNFDLVPKNFIRPKMGKAIYRDQDDMERMAVSRRYGYSETDKMHARFPIMVLSKNRSYKDSEQNQVYSYVNLHNFDRDFSIPNKFRAAQGFESYRDYTQSGGKYILMDCSQDYIMLPSGHFLRDKDNNKVKRDAMYFVAASDDLEALQKQQQQLYDESKQRNRNTSLVRRMDIYRITEVPFATGIPHDQDFDVAKDKEDFMHENAHTGAINYGYAQTTSYREAFISHVYYAMQNMTRILNTDMQSLNRDELNLQIAAAGNPYELGHFRVLSGDSLSDTFPTINISEHGSGCLSHELGHFMSYEYQKMNHQLDSRDDGLLDAFEQAFYSPQASSSPAMKKLVQAIRYDSDGNPSNYITGAKLFDDSTPKREDYFAKPAELFARSFATYCHDRAISLGIRDDFLNCRADWNDRPVPQATMANDLKREFTDNAQLHEMLCAPQGSERIRIDNCFDELIDEMKERGFLKDQKHEWSRYRRGTDHPIDLVLKGDKNQKEKIALPMDDFQQKRLNAFLENNEHISCAVKSNLPALDLIRQTPTVEDAPNKGDVLFPIEINPDKPRAFTIPISIEGKENVKNQIKDLSKVSEMLSSMTDDNYQIIMRGTSIINRTLNNELFKATKQKIDEMQKATTKKEKKKILQTTR